MWRRYFKSVILMLILMFFISGCGFNKVQEKGIMNGTVKSNNNLTYRYGLNNSPKFGLQAIYFINGKDGWAGGQGIILATNDGGQNWAVQYTGSFNITSFDFINSLYGWALSDNSLLRTTDGGKSWMELPYPKEKLKNIKFVNINKGFGISNGKLYLTLDGGQSWKSINTKIKIESYDFIDEYNGWASYNNNLYYTKDGGLTWNLSYDPNLKGKWDVVLDTFDYNNIWVLYRGSKTAMNHQPYMLLKTSDGGRKWQTIAEEGYFKGLYGEHESNNNLGSYVSTINVVDKNTAFVIGINPVADNGKIIISRTTDDGNTWNKYDIPQFDSESLIEGITPISFVDTYNGWIAATKNGNGIILSTLDGGQTWQQQYPVKNGNNQIDYKLVNPVIIDALKDFAGNSIIKIYAPSVVPLPDVKKNSYIAAIPYMGKFNRNYKVDLILTDKPIDINSPEIEIYRENFNNILGNFGGSLFSSSDDAENYIKTIELNNGFIIDDKSKKLNYKDFIWGNVYYKNGITSIQWREGRWIVEVNAGEKPEIELAKQMVKYLQDYNLPVPLYKGLIVVNIFNGKTTTNIYWTKDSSVYYINYNFKPIDALQMAVSMKQN